jgi:hypothetical protein
VQNGYVFVSTDYGTGAVLLKLASDGGSVKASEVYFTRDMRNHYTTSVLVGDHVYGFSSSILTAMSLMTGKIAWNHRSVGNGNCIYADGRLYCLGEGGTVGLIDPSPAGYKEVSRFEIPPGRNPTLDTAGRFGRQAFRVGKDNLYFTTSGTQIMKHLWISLAFTLSAHCSRRGHGRLAMWGGAQGRNMVARP